MNAQLATPTAALTWRGWRSRNGKLSPGATKARTTRTTTTKRAWPRRPAKRREQSTALVKLFRDENPKQLLSEAKLPVEVWD